MTAATKTAAPSPCLPLEELTAREVEVLTLAADGLSNAEIGARLFVSPNTVKCHMLRIGRKLGCRERAGMVGAAFRRGILLPDVEQATAKPDRDRERALTAVESELDGLTLRIVILLLRGATLETLVPLARRAHRMAVVTRRLR